MTRTSYRRYGTCAAWIVLVVAGVVLLAAPAQAQTWQQRVIYQIVTDRFVDGNKDNNDPPQSKGLFDPQRKNWQAYWGGDLQGIQSKLDYLRKLGIGAVWISPAQDCVNCSVSDTDVVAPYHGYWPRDFKRIDEHFGDEANSWAAFDSLAGSLHARNMRLVVDFVPNHTSPVKTGEHGALFDDGKPFATPKDHPQYFHITPTISDWNDPDQLQHRMIFDLADLNQSNPAVSNYLIDAACLMQQHGADGFRIDSMKHINWDWLPVFVSAVRAGVLSATASKGGPPASSGFCCGPPASSGFCCGPPASGRLPTEPSGCGPPASSGICCGPPASRRLPVQPFVFGEWFQGATSDPTYPQSARVANVSRMSELDYPLAMALRNAFGKDNASFESVRATLEREDKDFREPGNLVTFLDNHDIPRFLNIQPDRQRLHLALVFLLACRGVPCIYYGTEQYLYDPTDGGKDPYDRPMMSSFSTDTPAFALISRLAALRRTHPALSSGDMRWLVVKPDVCSFARVKEQDRLVVAINKSASAQTLEVDAASLPPGVYRSALAGQPELSLTVLADGSARCTMPAQSCAVWLP